MKQTVYFSDFTAAFHRADRGNQFSYDALRVLFDYIEEIENDTGEEIELDVIALCCEYAESTADEVIESYGLEDEAADMDDEEKAELVRDYLQDETALCGETDSGAFVYLQF